MQGLSFSGIGGQYYYVMAQLQNKTRIFLDKLQYFFVARIRKNPDFGILMLRDVPPESNPYLLIAIMY
jgi:hypothetical protein